VLLGGGNNLWKYLSFQQIRSLQAKWGWLRVCYSLCLLSGKDNEAIQQYFRDHTLWSATINICAETQAHRGSLVQCGFGADQVSHACTFESCANFWWSLTRLHCNRVSAFLLAGRIVWNLCATHQPGFALHWCREAPGTFQGPVFLGSVKAGCKIMLVAVTGKYICLVLQNRSGAECRPCFQGSWGHCSLFLPFLSTASETWSK